jgi:ribosomal protein S18 acetylase RimI-like enzyme
MTMSTVTGAQTSGVDHDRAIAVLSLAFSTDPMVRWAWPDAFQYTSVFATFARAMAGAAFEHGTAYCAQGYLGAALWLPPGASSDEEAMVEITQSTIAAERHDEMFGIFERIAEYHPTETHWYLPLIGVDPIHQSKGHGAALMQPALDACDRDGLPAYLESSNARNISFYERLGFEVLGTIQAGTSPTMYPMLRKPRS